MGPIQNSFLETQRKKKKKLTEGQETNKQIENHKIVCMLEIYADAFFSTLGGLGMNQIQ